MRKIFPAMLVLGFLLSIVKVNGQITWYTVNAFSGSYSAISGTSPSLISRNH